MDSTTRKGTFEGYRSDWRHLAWSFLQSRDKWRDKYQVLKVENKRLKNQVNDLRKSRELWRQRAQEAQAQLQQLQQDNAQLQAQLAATQAELAEEKKS